MSSHFLLPRHFQQAASSAITLLHPSNKQLFLVHPSKEQPVLPSHFCIPRTSSQFCSHTFASPNKQLFLLPHLFQRAASSAITLLHPSSKQLVLLPHFCTPRASSQFCCHTFASLEQAAIFAATPLLTGSQFCCHTSASSNKQPFLLPHHFQQGANFVVTLLHPSNKQPFLLPHFLSSTHRPGLTPTPFLIRRHFCCHTFASFEQVAISGTAQLFLLSHLFQRAASFAVTLLHPSNKQPFLLPHFSSYEPPARSCCHTILTRSQFCCHTIQQGASSAITLLHPRTSNYFGYHTISTKSQFCCHTFASSNKQPFLLPHFASFKPAASSAATPFQQGANSAATLLHPSNKQLSLLPTSSNEQPVLLPTSLPTSCQLCHYTFASPFQKPRLPLLLR
jgi:hypothetical protein